MRKEVTKWLGFLSMIPALAMIYIDQSILSVALPTIGGALHVSQVTLIWFLNAYLLSLACFLLLGGKFADGYGAKICLLLGIGIFLISSMLLAVLSSKTTFIIFRALGGIGASLAIPSSVIVLRSLFEPIQRGRAVGMNVSLMAFFLVLGPIVGGYIVHNFSWRWIFLINLLPCLVSLVMIYYFVPKCQRQEFHVDGAGFIFYFFSISCFIVFIMQGKVWNWVSVWSFLFLGFFVVFGALLVYRETKAQHPYLEISLFKIPVYRAVNISVFSVQFMIAMNIFRVVFFQETLGWSPMSAGSLIFVSNLPLLFMPFVGGFLSDRFGPKVPVSIGFFLLIFSFFWLASFIHFPRVFIWIGLLSFGLGAPMILTPSSSAAMNHIPKQKLGTAFGTMYTVRYVGITMGTAIIATFLFNIQDSLFKSRFHDILQDKTNSSLLLQIMRSAEPEGIIKENFSSPQSMKLIEALHHSRITAMRYAHLALGFLLILALLVVFNLYHRRSKHTVPTYPPEGFD